MGRCENWGIGVVGGERAGGVALAVVIDVAVGSACAVAYTA